MKLRLKIAIMLAFALGPFLGTVAAKSADSSDRYVVKVNGKYGFIDHSGKMVIPPAYDKALAFSDGLSVVYVGMQCGFIDTAGKLVAQPQFDDCMPFAEGMAAVKSGNQWGYIDQSGTIAIKPQFENTITFREGMAFVEAGKVSGVIDKTGKMLFQVNGSGGWFSEHRAAVREHGIESKMFYVDSTGQRAFPSTFESGGDFSEGLASVTNENKSAYIDPTGKIVIPFQLWSPWGGFSEGLAVVFIGQGRAAYIDKTGKEVITGDFVRADPFSEGLAAVMLRAGKDIVSTAQAQGSSMVMIKPGAKYGYIDKTGAVVVPAQFAKAGKFVGGLAQVCLESTEPFDVRGMKQPCGYIDKTGTMIWQPSK
jgi:hypothetical protein